jgi:hypothetical protein
MPEGFFPIPFAEKKQNISAIDSMNSKSGKHALFLISLTILIAQNITL